MSNFRTCEFLFIRDNEHPVESSECMCKFKDVHQPSNCNKCPANCESFDLILDFGEDQNGQ